MQIVHVVRQYFPFIGGMEFVVHDLARAQAAAGHQVRVVTLTKRLGGNYDSLPREEVIDGVEIRRIKHYGGRRYPIAPGVLFHLKGADIVHVHAIDFFFDFLGLLNIFRRATLIASTHGGFFHTKKFQTLKRVWFNLITRLSLNGYAALICVSDQDRDTFTRIRPRGIDTIVNGVNTRKFSAIGGIDAEPKMIAIGRFSPNKGYEALLDTLAELRKSQAWKLTIAGAPDQLTEADLQHMVDTRSLGESVTVLSSPDQETLRETIGQCSVFVSASSYEGFGIAAVEALSAGLEVVLNDIPPYRKLVDELGQGLVLDFNRPRDAAENIAAWQRRRDPSVASRRERIAFADRYSIEASSDRTSQLYLAAKGKTIRNIAGLDVSVFDDGSAIKHLDGIIENGERSVVAFANSNLINKLDQEEKRRISGDSSILVLNDGIAMDIASRLIYGEKFPSNLNGTDFLSRWLSDTSHSLRIFLLGGREGVANAAAEKMRQRHPSHQFVGCLDGYFAQDDSERIADIIKRSGADILICGMGNPLQEQWLMANFMHTNCKIGFAAGAFLDFNSGRVPRAPLWLRRARLEWLFRLCREPKRLILRYTIGIGRFALSVGRQAASMRRIS